MQFTIAAVAGAVRHGELVSGLYLRTMGFGSIMFEILYWKSSVMRASFPFA